jgi:hypothetical protein
VTANPDITTAIPAVIAGHPYPVPVCARRSRDDLNRARRRRPDSDHDLRGGDARSQNDGCGGGKKISLQVHSFLLEEVLDV